jgi:hypothetical protein
MSVAAGQIIRASDITQTGTYSAILRETAAQSISNNSATAVTFSISDYDPSAGHSGSGSTWTAPVAGLYLLVASGGCVGNATGRVDTRIAVNATSIALVERPNSVTSGGNQAVSVIASLAIGDAVTMVVFQNSGGSINTSINGGDPKLTIALLAQL